MTKRFLIITASMLVSLALHASDMNVTASPDGLKQAFTRDNDLWVSIDGVEKRLTADGSDLILNGYASWVYYEEIFGRASKYKAFWWSPDSRKLAFYRFDNTNVPMFPIYSPFGQDGSLSLTRYPKAGEPNPVVRVGIADVETGSITWADFAEDPDQYFGTPFWGNDSAELFVPREPRRQSRLDLYSISVADGSGQLRYHEEYPTWIDWIDEVIFTPKGLYMARDFQTGWQQIYFLSYDGKTFKRLTDGPNWDMHLLKVDERRGDVWFVAKRDSRLHPTVYKLNRKGVVTALTDPEMWADFQEFSADGKSFTAKVSNARTPWSTVRYRADRPGVLEVVAPAEDFDPADTPLPQQIKIRHDGFDLYGLITYPRDFDPARKYPVIMEVYGGPGTAYVRDRWNDRDASNRWAWENGVIWMCVDPRSSGENGREGMDQAFRQMTVIELEDYIAWARHMQSLPYVKADRIGVDGFSFGGTTTSMLVMRYPEYFHCGIAGGGVYDWTLYDSAYTERFMDTPQANPGGYARATVLNYVEDCSLVRLEPQDGPRAYLKLTHGTGDDNVHFQNTLQFVDALQRCNCDFELMIYPDGMHGYRGLQHAHDVDDAAKFWTRYLLDK
ncbi:MAG: DPP IV N-terminal domain-containing protein [Bacteroidales bacterium]|nr:DPP IV N-terminal domain-containing protein [Candidatus Cryptobacteroides choladohippi]